jgi:sulfur-oxidizing protein SoxY
MNQSRRDMLRITSVLGMAFTAGLLKPSDVFAGEWSKAAFEAKSMEDVVKALGGGNVTVSDAVSVNGPDIAENGAVVPVTVTSTAPNTEYMAILVEKNPSSLSAGFNIPAGTDPSVSTRVKMGSTSNVHALVKANGKWLIASKEIKVTLGGCGG